MYYQQSEYAIRCDWGLAAIEHVAPISDVVVIVDAISFSTSVDIATSRGALVYPYRWKQDVEQFAAQRGAVVASSSRSTRDISLSPVSLLAIAPGTKIVLPSPHGATLSLATGNKPTLAGCFRNANAVASRAQQLGKNILVVPAGERWPDGTLRPAIEDLIGAGAIIHPLQGARSPEAAAAEAAFLHARDKLSQILLSCSSGKELAERGFGDDVLLTSQYNVSACAPILLDGAYQASF